jgi:urease accessory protein
MTPIHRMRTASLIACGWAVLAAPALAHPGHGDTTLAAGLVHPLSGLDHILAMVAVGVMAARRGGKAMLLWPLAFVAAMLAGYGLGVMDHGAISLEPGVLASVIVLGALAICATPMPMAAGVAVIGLFGLCHGFAHGAEAPAGAGAGFPVGFAVSTAFLHGLGLMIGLGAMRLRRPKPVRAARTDRA